MSSTTNGIIIPDVLKAADPELLQAALTWAAEVKAKQEKAKKPKAEQTPAQKAAAELKALKKALAEANGLKTTRVAQKAVNRVNGRGKINDEAIFAFAAENNIKTISIHKGKLSALTWLTLTLDIPNRLYINGAENYTSLSDAHKAFAAGASVAVRITLHNSYWGKPVRNKALRLDESDGSDEWLSYTPKSNSARTSVAHASDDEAEPEADEEDDEEEAAPAPIPVPVPVPVAEIKKRGRPKKAVKKEEINFDE